MNRRLYGNASDGGFVAVQLGNAEAKVETFFPSSESLEKQSSCFGLFKWLARRRSGTVTCVAIFLLISLAVLVMFTLVFLFIRVGTAASGVTYDGPQRMPWHDEATFRRAVKEALGDTVTLESGVRVEHVVEPQEQMQTVSQVLVFARELEPSLSGVNEVSQDDIRRGYLPWRPFELAPRVNFTLAHMRRLMRAKHPPGGEETCVCYKAYQLPYDIVYLVESDEVLYQPVVLQESPLRVKSRRESNVYRLVRQARRETHWDEDVFHETAASGKLLYFTDAAMKRRTQIGEPEFPCIKHCLTLFDRPVLEEQ